MTLFLITLLIVVVLGYVLGRLTDGTPRAGLTWAGLAVALYLVLAVVYSL